MLSVHTRDVWLSMGLLTLSEGSMLSDGDALNETLPFFNSLHAFCCVSTKNIPQKIQQIYEFEHLWDKNSEDATMLMFKIKRNNKRGENQIIFVRFTHTIYVYITIIIIQLLYKYRLNFFMHKTSFIFLILKLYVLDFWVIYLYCVNIYLYPTDKIKQSHLKYNYDFN